MMKNKLKDLMAVIDDQIQQINENKYPHVTKEKQFYCLGMFYVLHELGHISDKKLESLVDQLGLVN